MSPSPDGCGMFIGGFLGDNQGLLFAALFSISRINECIQNRLRMLRRQFFKSKPYRRVPLLKRWWRDLLYLWSTGSRLPWALAAGALLAVMAFALLIQSMVITDMRRRDVTCLALNVYHEARGEPLEGQFGVAEVTMNRVAHPRYPDSVCEVVHQKRWDYLRKRYVSAFSWTEFDTLEEPEGDAWQRALSVAQATLDGDRSTTLDGAVHYHATHIRPSWSRGKRPVARIGRHLFYR